MTGWLKSAPAGAVLAWVGMVLLPAAGLAQQQPEPTITLNEAVERALQVSPVMVQRQGAIRTASSAERVAWGDFIPSLSMSSGASRSSATRYSQETNTTITVPTSNSYSARLSSSVDLFTGGRRMAQMRQVRAQTDAAEVALLEQRFNVALQAKRAYFEVLRNDDLVRVTEERIERAARGLEAAIRRIQVGSGTRSDSLRSQLEMTQARQSLLQAQTNRRNAAFALGAMVGYNGPVGAAADQSLARTPLSMTDEELVAIVLEQSPAVQTAEANLRANQAGMSSARSQYFPNLSLSGSYAWNNSEVSINTGNTSWSTSIGLSYPIFNGFSREDANERASVNVTISRAQLEDAQRQARVGLDRILANLRLGEQQIELAEEALRVAQEDLRVLESRYALGAATILDQIISQIAVTEAEINLIAARYDYQIARAELEALVGREL
jgi:outer membrane protein